MTTQSDIIVCVNVRHTHTHTHVSGNYNPSLTEPTQNPGISLSSDFTSPFLYTTEPLPV